MPTIITDNGKINVQGKNITIIDGVLTVDGKTVDSDIVPKGNVTINCDGDLISISTIGNVTCKTVIGSVVAGGSVHVSGNIEGTVQSGHSVMVKGNITNHNKVKPIPLNPPQIRQSSKSLFDIFKDWW